MTPILVRLPWVSLVAIYKTLHNFSLESNIEKTQHGFLALCMGTPWKESDY